MNVEELIFEMYKDKPILNMKELKKELTKKFKKVNCRDLVIKINNYQIDKYGRPLGKYNFVFMDGEDVETVRLRERSRRAHRRNRKR